MSQIKSKIIFLRRDLMLIDFERRCGGSEEIIEERGGVVVEAEIITE